MQCPFTPDQIYLTFSEVSLLVGLNVPLSVATNLTQSLFLQCGEWVLFNISLKLSSHVTQNGCKLNERKARAPPRNWKLKLNVQIARKPHIVYCLTLLTVKEGVRRKKGGGKGASNISYKLQALKALRLCKTQAHFRLKFIYKISKIETRTQKRERKKN